MYIKYKKVQKCLALWKIIRILSQLSWGREWVSDWSWYNPKTHISIYAFSWPPHKPFIPYATSKMYDEYGQEEAEADARYQALAEAKAEVEAQAEIEAQAQAQAQAEAEAQQE